MNRHALARSFIPILALSLAVLVVGCATPSPSAEQTPVVPSAGASHTAPPASRAPSRTATPVASVAPSASGIRVLGVSGSGAFGAGTYAPAFEPALTFTLAEQTLMGPGGTIAYESVGGTDVNSPGWVSISFGFDKPSRHGSGTWSADFSIERIDKVFDSRHPNKPMDPPKDLAEWIAHLPGVSLSAPPAAVRVGGLEATQLDLVAGEKGLTIGPIPDTSDPPAFGMGPRQPARLTVLTVDGHHILVELGGVDGADHLTRVIAALQPLVDSIVWQ